MGMNDEQKPNKTPEDSHESDEPALEPAVRDLEEAVTAYLRRATETFDLSKNVEVCDLMTLEFGRNSRQFHYQIAIFHQNKIVRVCGN